VKVLLLLRKDLLILRRSPALLGVLLAYPVVIAILIGLLAGYANAKPRVALVDEDHLPATIVLAGKSFHVDRAIDEVAKNVRLVRMSRSQGESELRSGRVAALVRIPPGFLETLQGLVSSPHLILETGSGGITSRVRQQMQALVYNLNLRLQQAFVAADLRYVELLRHGGTGRALGRTFDIIGFAGASGLLRGLPRTKSVRELERFFRDAQLALTLTTGPIKATATPIVLVEESGRGRSSLLGAQVQSYGLALTITFLSLLLAAGSLAAERDENVIGRLARGLVSLGQLVWAKVLLAAAVALALGVTIAVAFGIAVDAGRVAGGEPWQRLPVALVGTLLAGASVGAAGALVGALAREARGASLAAILLALPVIFVGLVPREIVPPAGWVSDAFPFVHAVRFFGSALYDSAPWGTLLREGAWLLGLGLLFGTVARAAARRLAA